MSAYRANSLVLSTLLCALCWVPAGAGERTATKQTTAESSINIVVYNYAEVSTPTLRLAKAEAARIFLETGVIVNWLDYTVRDEAKQWEETTPSLRLVLKIFPRAMAKRLRVHPSASGFALVSPDDDQFAQFAYVFYHRAQELAAFSVSHGEGTVGRNSVGQRRLGAILGHLIAHEIGHLLLGPNSHSSKGIMSSLWGPLSLGRAISGKLQFTSEEARQIREQLEKRIQAAQLVR